MRQLLYVSNTSRKTTTQELAAILDTSRVNNTQAGVTGMLLYLDGGFLQILEGEPAALDTLYARIAEDKRHWNTAVLLDREAPRAFANWSMGFKSVAPEDGNAFELTLEAIKDRRLPPDLMVMLKTFYSVQA